MIRGSSSGFFIWLVEGNIAKIVIAIFFNDRILTKNYHDSILMIEN